MSNTAVIIATWVCFVLTLVVLESQTERVITAVTQNCVCQSK
jgi:hypothetical protein